MEKRFFLAILLSFCAVLLWSSLTPRPQGQGVDTPFVDVESKKLSLKESPDNLVKTTEVIKNTLQEDDLSNIREAQNFEEEITRISTNKLSVEFTSKGGNIHRARVTGFKEPLPVRNIFDILEYEDKEFSLERNQDGIVQYSYIGDGVKVQKTYKLSNDSNLMEAEVQFENTSLMSKNVHITPKAYILDMSILKNLKEDNFQREKGLYEYSHYNGKKVVRKGNAVSFNEKNNKGYDGVPKWVGFRNHYGAVLVKPFFEMEGHKFSFIDENKLQNTFRLLPFDLKSNEVKKYNVRVYVGPQKRSLLKDVGDDFEKIFAFSRFALLNGISLFIHWLVNTINKFVPNWGLCIILTSTIIYLSMYPLTLRGMMSMKRMQAMQPKIAELKEKYKDNPQRMNKEMMDIYKKHKINPLGGCLPFILQMPIFIGLYQVLWRSVEFKGASFLWIKDLSQPDRLFTFSQKIPIIGNEFNILPIFMMIIMFFQQKLSAKNMNITDPAQLTQQKFMAIFFPLFLGFLFYKFASGLTLYFTVFYLFSTFTQWKMSKKTEVVL